MPSHKVQVAVAELSQEADVALGYDLTSPARFRFRVSGLRA